MGFLQVILALTALCAYTQASVVYGTVRQRSIVNRGGYRSNPTSSIVTDDAYIPARLGLVRGKSQGYGAKDTTFGRSGLSSRGRRFQDEGFGLRDVVRGSLGRVGDSSYDSPLSRPSGGKYNAGSLVQDLYNSRRAGGSRLDSGRRQFGNDRLTPRDCNFNCLRDEVCELNSLGRPACLPVTGGFRQQQGVCDDRDSSTIYNRCSTRRGTQAYIFMRGSCQRFTSRSGVSCIPKGTINNIFRDLSSCERQCLY